MSACAGSAQATRKTTASQLRAVLTGVGVTLTLGEVLDPVNDLVEQFSSLMLAAAVAHLDGTVGAEDRADKESLEARGGGLGDDEETDAEHDARKAHGHGAPQACLAEPSTTA